MQGTKNAAEFKSEAVKPAQVTLNQLECQFQQDEPDQAWVRARVPGGRLCTQATLNARW